ncbi:MAG: hypothetical protein ACI9G1_001509 [Pirellulaceae bacterium]|jgi:hypothetical protein
MQSFPNGAKPSEIPRQRVGKPRSIPIGIIAAFAVGKGQRPDISNPLSKVWTKSVFPDNSAQNQGNCAGITCAVFAEK